MTLYDTLGVSTGASAAEIDKAYRRKAHKVHPDRGGDTEAFQRIEQAGRVLRDPVKRLRYDRTGQAEESCDNAPLTDEQQAIIVLKGMFIKCLEHSFEKGGDPVAIMRAEIHRGMQEGPVELAKQRRKISKLEKARSKHLKGRANSPAHLEQALDGHIYTQKQHLAQMELAVRIGPLMLEMMKVYSWEDDTPSYSLQSINWADIEQFKKHSAMFKDIFGSGP